MSGSKTEDKESTKLQDENAAEPKEGFPHPTSGSPTSKRYVAPKLKCWGAAVDTTLGGHITC